MQRFGLGDYWKMFKARGLKLPLTYFFQAQLFDLLRGTDTHDWLQKQDFDGALKDEPHGEIYMCTWTAEVDRAHAALRNLLGEELDDWSFVDIGCGKGKVCLIWAEKTALTAYRGRIFGVDYLASLIAIAERNKARRGNPPITFIRDDARNVDYAAMGERLIVFLFNPFDQALLAQVVARIAGTRHLIVYVNPRYQAFLQGTGYRLLWRRQGWHTNDTIAILAAPGSGIAVEQKLA
jgi:SAM-dependent methyltransferase